MGHFGAFLGPKIWAYIEKKVIMAYFGFLGYETLANNIL